MRRIEKRILEELKTFPYPFEYQYDKTKRVWQITISDKQIYVYTLEDIYNLILAIKNLCNQEK